MMPRKLHIALAATLLALATISAVDSASAGLGGFRYPGYSVGYILSTLP
jgi:hypothetical protein